VSCPRNNIYFAGSQLAVFQGANERPYLNHTGRESNAEKRPTDSGPKGCDENGPATALLVGHVSIEICSAPRALSTAHFDRNKIHAISGTGHWRGRGSDRPRVPKAFNARAQFLQAPIPPHFLALACMNLLPSRRKNGAWKSAG
jgi:hypothetical protein